MFKKLICPNIEKFGKCNVKGCPYCSPQPIQKEEEVKVKDCPICKGYSGSDCDLCGGVGYIPDKETTPSDTFIEGEIEIATNDILSIFDDDICGAKLGLVMPDSVKEDIKNILKSSLQSQRQSILEEIEKLERDWEDGDLGLSASAKFVLEDIKQVIKDNKD